ncbi:MAG: ATP-dependent sacrificial sulfur transferase LarE, partial [Thermoplasmata archaeon]
AARAVGISHEEIGADPLGLEEYRKNPSNRCYFCRKVETEALQRFGSSRGILQYLDGVHVDDLGDDRPGLVALEEAGFLHPLLRAGWNKTAVRAYARARDLPQWDRPSNACLASRIAHGQEITAELLGRIDAAESAVRRHGFLRVRVRVAGATARVEVAPDEVGRLREETIESAVRRELGGLGFPSVEIDPRGYPARRGG